MMLVVDASVAILAFGHDEMSSKARAVLDGEDWRSPDIFLGECANTLARLVRTRSITAPIARSAFDLIRRVAGDPVDTEALVPAAFRMALDLNHSVFDCLYLEVARALQCRVVTVDGRFASKITSTSFASLIVHLSDWQPEEPSQ